MGYYVHNMLHRYTKGISFYTEKNQQTTTIFNPLNKFTITFLNTGYFPKGLISFTFFFDAVIKISMQGFFAVSKDGIMT